MAIKLFNQSNQHYLAEKQEKIRAMLSPHYLSSFVIARQQPDFAWPTCTIHRDANEKSFIGFGMNDLSDYEPLSDLFSTTSEHSKKFSELERASVCGYLAHLFALCHGKDVLIGDVKPDNIRLNIAKKHLSIIDCDSFQISYNGKVFTSDVGTREYISRRLISIVEKNSAHVGFKGVVRFEEDDAFCLAIICFRILMRGYHPFQTAGMDRSILQNIREQKFPYSGAIVRPPKHAPMTAYNAMPQALRDLFEAAFAKDKPVTALAWRDAFHEYARLLLQQGAATQKSSKQRAQVVQRATAPTSISVSGTGYFVTVSGTPIRVQQGPWSPTPPSSPPVPAQPSWIERCKAFLADWARKLFG
jgi:DNA-binding helix-hairpin-helix protein with protein kinase domain